MMSASEGEGAHGKADAIRELRPFYCINQVQMRKRGEGVKKSEIFVDIINGSSLTRDKIRKSQLNDGGWLLRQKSCQ